MTTITYTNRYTYYGNIRVEYLYTPRSGSKLLRLTPPEWLVGGGGKPPRSPQIGVITWRNGSHHILSIGCIHLSWRTATPGQYWRVQAVEMAAAIARATGGVAWDDRGSVGLVVPYRFSLKAWRLMRTAQQAAGCKQPHLHDDPNAIALITGTSWACPGYALNADLTDLTTEGVVAWDIGDLHLQVGSVQIGQEKAYLRVTAVQDGQERSHVEIKAPASWANGVTWNGERLPVEELASAATGLAPLEIEG